MNQTIEEFFHDFRQEILVRSSADGRFQLDEFMASIANELIETGFTEGFEFCHYRAQRGMRVDGYWFNDEGVLDLFVADYESREDLLSLTATEVAGAFKRVINFFEASYSKDLAGELEITSPEYGLAREIADRRGTVRQLNVFLFSERMLSERVRDISATEVAGIPTNHHVWDISRLHRQSSSRGQKEPLDLDFEQMFGKRIPCLPAHQGAEEYQSYLMVMPADIMATLYDKFGSRLLEQNVRTFLQARGAVNKGIRATILSEPEMFFAYNNGISATAQKVEVESTDSGLAMSRILDLQIVNGGQTTASLFHTRKRDKADLSKVFVQMKLSVIEGQRSELVVPKISQYANTQNRVNAADFFSNHPFHIRMEEFSRRIWAPAQKGSQRETKWFYERARGQYADAQSKLTSGEQRRFRAEYPKPQMFTKTDLAKFENVWDDHPKWVNLGSQKNFARYAARIGSEWDKSPDGFNEFYYKRSVARCLIFRAAERLVSAQPWYSGGYRANIVAYALAVLSEIARRRKEAVDFLGVWNAQAIGSDLEDAIVIVAKAVFQDITNPTSGISNVTEWCKKDACWDRIRGRMKDIEKLLPQGFFDRLVSLEYQQAEAKGAKQVQKIDDGIEAQRQVLAVPSKDWARIHQALFEKGALTPKESGILRVAMQIPAKVPSEKQCVVLLEILEKAYGEGIVGKPGAAAQ